MFDYAVVGGGIVGLSTAKTILQRDANARLLLSKSAHGGRAGVWALFTERRGREILRSSLRA